jgi:iron complex outermembrane recepter protein
LDVTPFRIDWSDLQLTQISPAAQNYVSNVGAARIDGVEAQLTWQVPGDWPLVPDGLTLTSTFSYLDARTTEYFESANGAAEAGTRLPLSPKKSGSLGLAWQQTWNALSFSSSAQAVYASDRKNDLIETYRLPSYQTYAASFRVSHLGWHGAPAISLSGTNLSNEHILYNATPVTAQRGEFVYIPQGLPRTVKLSLELTLE